MNMEYIEKFGQSMEEEAENIQNILQEMVWACNGGQFWTDQDRIDKLAQAENLVSESRRYMALAIEAFERFKAMNGKR